jgi:diaminohydroxyphosphoribosylaminopyrimidine deaminase/5-amino-6-(5-phosphoribosylamino)uracil reductase
MTATRDSQVDDRRYMARALELARRGEGFTAPNPMVGCVVVRDGEIVGEGWHEGPGRPHAEIVALSAAGEAAKGSTIFVTLEPCSHFGRTPPCVDGIVASGVKEVVYTFDDPNPLAAGGAGRLERRGVSLRKGVLADEARRLNRAWLHKLETGRPLIVAKVAMSLDGRIATTGGESKWITGSEARLRAHELRQWAGAIIAGANTVAADDPELTARIADRPHANPLRVVLDSTARSWPGAKAFERTSPGALLATTAAASTDRLAKFEEHGVETLILETDDRGRPDLRSLVARIGERGIDCMLVEGGAAVLGAFFDARLVDELWVFTAPIVIGGEGRPAVAGLGAASIAAAAQIVAPQYETLGRDWLVHGAVRYPEPR